MAIGDLTPDFPPIRTPWVIDWLMEVGPTDPGAMGAVPISWATIGQWQHCMGLDLPPWLVRLLRRLSVEFVAEAILTAGKYAVAILYAGWVGGFNAIRVTWTALPGVVGEAAVGAANLAISGIEYLANKAIAALNWLAEWVNPVLDRVGLATITRIESVALPRMENSFAGSTARMGAQVRDELGLGCRKASQASGRSSKRRT